MSEQPEGQRYPVAGELEQALQDTGGIHVSGASQPGAASAERT